MPRHTIVILQVKFNRIRLKRWFYAIAPALMLTISGWKLRQNGPIRLESGLEIIFFRGTIWETENIVKGRDKSELNSA